MSQTSDRIAVACPSCSPAVETGHEILNDGGHLTVRCSTCGHVHKTTAEPDTRIERRVIVSQEGESFESTGRMEPDEELTRGDEFLLETEEAIFEVRITSLELVGGGRTAQADATDVKTIWTRAVGNVVVNLTLHPGDGSHDASRSEQIRLPGDERLTVGETTSFGDEQFTVQQVIVRDEVYDYPFQRLEQPGDAVAAKDIKRVYALDATSSTGWSAW